MKEHRPSHPTVRTRHTTHGRHHRRPGPSRSALTPGDPRGEADRSRAVRLPDRRQCARCRDHGRRGLVLRGRRHPHRRCVRLRRVDGGRRRVRGVAEDGGDPGADDAHRDRAARCGHRPTVRRRPIRRGCRPASAPSRSRRRDRAGGHRGRRRVADDTSRPRVTWKPVAAVAAIGFVLGIGLLSVGEGLLGRPVSGSGAAGTTIGAVSGGPGDAQPPPRPSSTPSPARATRRRRPRRAPRPASDAATRRPRRRDAAPATAPPRRRTRPRRVPRRPPRRRG